MTKEILQLERLEEYHEGNQLEAKAAQGGMPNTLWDSYSAFANTDGGCILLGVKEYDVKAMLELYDHPEELTFPDTEVSDIVSENGKNVDKLAIKRMIGGKLATIRQNESNIGDNDAVSPKTGDKLPIRDEVVDKLADIVVFLGGTTESNSTAISQLIGKGISTTKNYLTLLINLDCGGHCRCDIRRFGAGCYHEGS